MSFVYVCHSLHIALWNNIHFIEVTKDFKSKYESLKEKEIYIHLVQALWKKGNQSEAIQVLNTALKMWPTSSELRDLKKYFSKLKSGS